MSIFLICFESLEENWVLIMIPENESGVLYIQNDLFGKFTFGYDLDVLGFMKAFRQM